MKNLWLIVALVVSLGVIGCGNKPQSASSSEAIKNAQSLPTVEAKLGETGSRYISEKLRIRRACLFAQY